MKAGLIYTRPKCYQCQFIEEEWHGKRRWYFCCYDKNNKKRIHHKQYACINYKLRLRDF